MPDPFDLPGTYMCPNCVGDEDVQQFIRDHVMANECSFCGRRRAKRAIAADADEVVEYIRVCLEGEYQDAAEEVMYISREGGYQADTMMADDVLYEAGFEPANEAAHEYIAHHLPDYAWVERDFYQLHPFHVLQYGWRGFSDTVKHETRYLFFKRRRPARQWEDSDNIPPEEMLHALGRLIRELGLVRLLPAGQLLYRVREHGLAESYMTLSELGPPPASAAIHSNRMSPAGISMLYAAEDPGTAIAETIDSQSQNPAYTVATLQLNSAIPIVDLVQLPRNPSVFTPGTTRESRANLNFIHAFARDVSHAINRDGMEHIEYVPTQVVTEYLKFRFRGPAKERVFGLRYGSAKCSGGVNLALFVGQSDLAPKRYVGTPHPVALSIVNTAKTVRIAPAQVAPIATAS